MPGVEVARGAHTSDATYEIMCELMRRTGRIPIPIRRELPGYLINRLSAALSREALRLWAEGVANAEDIELGMKSTIGFRMPFYGPFGHYDLSGDRSPRLTAPRWMPRVDTWACFRSG